MRYEYHINRICAGKHYMIWLAIIITRKIHEMTFNKSFNASSSSRSAAVISNLEVRSGLFVIIGATHLAVSNVSDVSKLCPETAPRKEGSIQAFNFLDTRISPKHVGNRLYMRIETMPTKKWGWLFLKKNSTNNSFRSIHSTSYCWTIILFYYYVFVFSPVWPLTKLDRKECPQGIWSQVLLGKVSFEIRPEVLISFSHQFCSDILIKELVERIRIHYW